MSLRRNHKWNLRINLDRSEKMNVRSGSSPRREQWLWSSQNVPTFRQGWGHLSENYRILGWMDWSRLSSLLLFVGNSSQFEFSHFVWVIGCAERGNIGAFSMIS
jgi:hypothetical protein